MNVNRIIALYGVAFMAIPSVFVANATPLPSKGEVGGGASTSIVEVPFTQVHVTDRFWAPRIEVNRTVSIPSAFRECEKAGRFDNFALAAKNNGNLPPSFGGAGGGFY